MMGTLHELSRRGVPIIVFNPLRERALERFADPQNVMEMATRRSTPIASTYYQVRAGGDAAALKGIAKALLQLEEEQGNVLDHALLPSIPRDSPPSPRISTPPAGRISNRSPA